MVIKKALILIAVTLSLAGTPARAQEGRSVPFLKGEKVVYNIKKLGIPVGNATIEFRGLTPVNGRNLVLIVFEATAPNFFDQEKIFADPATLLPVIVERDLNIFGSKEKITEYYSQNPPRVRVLKNEKGKPTEQVLANESVIDNLYCFIYRYRLFGKFDLGELLDLNLPTREVQVRLKEKSRIFAAGAMQNAYYMESIPPQYRVWFSEDGAKVPLRIDGGLGAIGASMILKSRTNG